jgi:glycosyltransferase involved in cell wall biosynthesis
MLLSVIVPTRNRVDTLCLVLDSLCRQTLSQSEFKVIVIDNGSIDDTCEMVRRFQQRIAHLYYYYDASPGLHVGRHRGFQEAQADILVYADDDIEAFPSWLQTIRESFEDGEVALVGGKWYAPRIDTISRRRRVTCFQLHPDDGLQSDL